MLFFTKTFKKLFYTPPGLETSEGRRARAREQKIFISAAASFVARGVSIATGLISVPLTLNYLGIERYGVWMTISSIYLVLQFADLGLGNGLLTSLSRASGNEDRTQQRELISSSFVFLSVLSAVLLTLFALLIPNMPWAAVFNVQNLTFYGEIKAAMLMFAVIFCVNLPLSLIEKTRLAYQEGHVNSIFNLFGNLLGFITMLWVLHTNKGLPWLVFALAGVPIVTLCLNGLLLFTKSRPWIKPSFKHVSSNSIRSLVKLGFLFFILQLTVSMSFNSDNIVVAHVIGPAGVAEIAVPARLFSVISTFSSLALVPLWPAYGEAIARGDINWVKSNFMSTLTLVALLTGAASLLLLLFGKPLLKAWVGSHFSVDTSLLVALAIWTTLMSCGNLVGMLYNAAAVIRYQIITAGSLAIIGIILKFVLATSWGVAGVIWATIFAYILCCAVPAVLFVPYLLKQLSGKKS